MTNKFLIYEGRGGARLLLPHNEKSWSFLLKEMEKGDGCSLEQAREQGYWIDGGSEYSEDCYVSLDDGGVIYTAELTVKVDDLKYF